ncbi:glycosyltransferase family 4 protein [Akkermansiaceae bacterium]|nr:glycosyltransferase family 4 protein [Akkermansiaceae bacterium]
MKITIITAGTGSYYCGACMRDNALAKALRAAGHNALIVPMYLPLQLDEEKSEADEETPVFFGGINVYLQQKYEIFRRLPRWFDRLLNGRMLLQAVAKRSHLTSAREQGEMTYEMLRLEESHLDKEVDKLIDWLELDGKPDVILLSNALLAGLILPLKNRVGAKVACTFQGEDSFLDGLPEPWKTKAWDEMSIRLNEADQVISPSQFYADLMEKKTGVPSQVIPNGIDLTGYKIRNGKNRIGYLSRMCHSKGLGLLVDAFIHLNDPTLTLVIAGTMGGGDAEYVTGLKVKLEEAGLSQHVEWHPDLDRDTKADLLTSLSVFSVPAVYPEAFGLYLIEAMACSVPVVMPRASAFVEIIESSECGILVEPENATALAEGIRSALKNPAAMGEHGRHKVDERYNVTAMAEKFVEMLS